MQAHVPYWILVLVGAMYRFVAGGFGVSLPHPYKAKICPRFWLVALPGCTIGLPFVLLGWAIRLTLGKGRAERFFDRVGDILDTPQAKVLGKVLLWIILTAVVGWFFFLLGYSIYKYGWWVVMSGILIGIGVSGAMIGLLVLIAFVGDKLRAWNAARPKREKQVESEEEKPSTLAVARKKSWTVLKTIFIVVTWLPKMVLLGVWQVLEFVGMVFYAGYKKFCPVVEFP